MAKGKKTKKKGAAKKTATKKTKKKGTAKKTKKNKNPEKVQLSHKKAVPENDINPVTGSRFAPGTSKQIALDFVCKQVADGKSVKEIRKGLAEFRKDNGKPRNLDAGYFTFVVATHPEFFEVWSDGRIKQVKKFKVDEKALAEFEKVKAERLSKKKERKSKSKSKTNKGKGKGKGKGGKKKPTLKK